MCTGIAERQSCLMETAFRTSPEKEKKTFLVRALQCEGWAPWPAVYCFLILRCTNRPQPAYFQELLRTSGKNHFPFLILISHTHTPCWMGEWNGFNSINAEDQTVQNLRYQKGQQKYSFWRRWAAPGKQTLYFLFSGIVLHIIMQTLRKWSEW